MPQLSISWGIVDKTAINQRTYQKKQSITQTTTQQQVEYLVNDLKNYTVQIGNRERSVYDVFMDPYATDGQLELASYAYWRWGEAGKRFNYAQSIYKSLTE